MTTTFVSASFTGAAGTNLTDYTGEVGATWTKHPSFSTNAILSNENRARVGGSGTTIYYASGLPSSADYEVHAVVHIKSATVANTGVVGRLDTSANTYYATRILIVGSELAVQLLKTVGGTETIFGDGGGIGTATGVDHNLTLDLNGTTVRALLAGVEQISVTDSSISNAGRVGVRLRAQNAGAASDSLNAHIDSFAALEADAGPSNPTTGQTWPRFVRGTAPTTGQLYPRYN